MTTPAIDLNDITFTYASGNAPALRGINLSVPSGQICAIVGRAGAGKSTLCALTSGFVPHFYRGQLSGTATVEGQDVIAHTVPELVRSVALVGSSAFSQISGARFTVYDEIGFTLENLGIPRPEMVERIEWALEAMKISHLHDRSPYALSGGQQQRMVIAAALALRPPVLVLDEPTAQLDPPATEELADLLRSLAHAGTTILVAEHRLEWAAELADRAIVLHEGQVIADGPPAATLIDPQLDQLGAGRPRPTIMAERARSAGFWPDERPLPATLQALVEGLTPHHGATGSSPDLRPPEQIQPRQNGAAAPIVALENVRFSYPSGVEALRGVSLTIGLGERVAFLGPNGAGKSTLVRHLNGLLRPGAGRAHVAGQSTQKKSVAWCARHVSIVFQDVRNQLFARTVRDELRFGPRNLGKTEAEIDALVARSLALLDLEHVADEHPYDLPPPRRRLVAVAAALAMDAELLVLDEPTAGLDQAGIRLLERVIHEQAQAQRSIVVVSHDLDFCFETLERMVLVRSGQIVLDSPAAALDPQERAELEQTVGLPTGMRATQLLGLQDGHPLSRLLIPDPAPLVP